MCLWSRVQSSRLCTCSTVAVFLSTCTQQPEPKLQGPKEVRLKWFTEEEISCDSHCLSLVQNSTCDLNSSCGSKDPLWSPSSLCGMTTPPSSRGMSPNLELSHSASHLSSRFHCTSGRAAVFPTLTQILTQVLSRFNLK